MALASLEDVNCSIAEESAQQDGKTSETAKVSSDQHILKLTRMHPELVTALGLPTTFLAAGSVWPVDVNINYDIKYTDVRDTLEKYVNQIYSSINLNRMPRDEACKAIVNHFLHVYPKYNVMIVFPKHIPSFDPGCLHFHIELKPFLVGTVGYEVYVFKLGYFTLLGDGGYDNWCFGGKFKRDGPKSVQFFDPCEE